ncbi:MAG: hypothetical protein LIO46_01065, partial [Clostridiales bacterium]|nr:hypothetical protein [Clostridiales bacterium]
DESYFRLRIESRPVFPDGGSEGSILIENPDYNSYPIRVQIWMNDTGEIIYDSGGSMPGHSVGNTKLAPVLSKGEYACTADVFQYDPDTLQAVGKTQAALVITIEN